MKPQTGNFAHSVIREARGSLRNFGFGVLIAVAIIAILVIIDLLTS